MSSATPNRTGCDPQGSVKQFLPAHLTRSCERWVSGLDTKYVPIVEKLTTVIYTYRKKGVCSMSTVTTIPMITLPDQFNAATAFLDRHLAEGRGAKTALY